MPDEVTLRSHRDGSGAVTTFGVSDGWGQTIVFNEGTYYPPIYDGTTVRVESREYDEYVVIQTENLSLLARQLGLEDTQTETGDILAAMVEFARTSEVTDLRTARRMLDALDVPYTDSTWDTR